MINDSAYDEQSLRTLNVYRHTTKLVPRAAAAFGQQLKTSILFSLAKKKPLLIGHTVFQQELEKPIHQ